MPLLLEASVVVVNTEELERLARREGTTANAVCMALANPSGRHGRTSAYDRDYLVLQRADLESVRPTIGEREAKVITVLAKATAVGGVHRLVVPSPSRQHGSLLSSPAFLGAAKRLTHVEEGATDQHGVAITAASVDEAIERGSSLIEPHVPGFRKTLAKAALSLRCPGLQEALVGEDLSSRALQTLAATLAMTIAIRSSIRIGSGIAVDNFGQAIALLRSVIKAGDDGAAWPFVGPASRVLSTLILGDERPKLPATSDAFHAVESLYPRASPTFDCPPDEVIDVAITSCLALAIQKERQDEEYRRLGLDSN